MDWGPFFGWVVVLLVLFAISTWPVTPRLDGKCGNVYAAKNLRYYGILFFHYFLGMLTLWFFILGLFRNQLFDNFGDNRQLSFLLAYSFLIASPITIFLVHRFAPLEQEEEEKEIEHASSGAANNGDVEENQDEMNGVEEISLA